MASGDLAGAKAWLLEDLKISATKRGWFYVMQANPNNAETKMYESMNRNDFPASNLDFLRGFLEDLPNLILQAVDEEPNIQINVIDSDFLNISKPYATAMQLMMPHSDFSSDTNESSVRVGSWVLPLAGVCGLLVCTFFLGCRRQSNGYQRRFASEL